MNEENLKSEIVTIIEMIILGPHGKDTPKCLSADDYLSYIDSIRFIELITEVETHFSIEISNEDLVFKNVENLDNLVSMVSKYINIKIIK